MDKKKLQTIIFREIDRIPPISQNIQKIKELAEDPYSWTRDIANLIRQDIALAAEVMKIANSARYMFGRKIDTIEGSINLIGFKELKTICLSFEARRSLSANFPGMEKIWQHSYRCGFYAQQIMKIKYRSKVWEDIYLAGLLHDIGKVVMISISPDLMDKVNYISQMKNVAITVVEKMAIGTNHAEIGSMIAERWNFPDQLIECIHYHHEPKFASEAYRQAVNAIYIANILSNANDGIAINYDSLDPNIMADLNLETFEKFQKVQNTLTEMFQNLALIQ